MGSNKVAPNICAPGSMTMPKGGGHTDGIKKGSHGRGGALARVSMPPMAASGGIPNPVQKPNSGLQGKKIGQPNPNTSAVATKKPNRKGAAAFYGEV